MPKREDIKKILILGSGPIVIGSGAEFDYSGTQACLALKELGYKTILVNPNPATIMTDKIIADKVYMEPLQPKFLKWIISIEKPDAIIPNLGGQTALNLCIELNKLGILTKYNVEVLGPPIQSIINAEDRKLFKESMFKLKIPMPPSCVVNNIEDGLTFAQNKYPIIIRPSYTTGGYGGGIANNEKELLIILKRGLSFSPINECMVEKSIFGYKEIEYEVMRDKNDTAIVVCNMENIDPVGIHTGDSMVVSPSLTLTNKQYQLLRDKSIEIIRYFKIEGGCNVQFALDQYSDNFYVIEINPRVSRSSALASKATGYPIARISAMIAVGMCLDEIINPITKKTYSSFEPSIDYIVTKLPRFSFDKFRSSSSEISTYMQATGESMAIGVTFEESFLKCLRSLNNEFTFTWDNNFHKSKLKLLDEIKNPNAYRIYQIFNAFRKNATVAEIYKLTKINKFFLHKFKNIIDIENELNINRNNIEKLTLAKKFGYSDYAIGKIWKTDSKNIYNLRIKNNIIPVFKMIDTCGGEFQSTTNYMYSTYNGIDNESHVSKSKKILIIGSGPIRIGQGVEFDYSTVHCIWSFKKMGYETIVINNNPETVSTDFSIADKLYFEPINYEDVKNIIDYEKPDMITLQFGGQTAINLSPYLVNENLNIVGSSVESIDISENRKKFGELLRKNNIRQPENTFTNNINEIPVLAKKIGYPVLIRPSYVIGGQGMKIVDNEKELLKYIKLNILDYQNNMILIDKFLPGKEIEVDCVSDGKDIFIPGIMEHIEKSGIHSGDSTVIYPNISIKPFLKNEIIEISKKIANILNVKGLMNIQYIIYNDELYVLEVNLRSSRSVPFISKSTKQNIIEYSCKILIGKKLKNIVPNLGEFTNNNNKYYIKSPVFSFNKLYKVTNTLLGPEMKSTGESIGIDYNIDKALYKSLLGANIDLMKHSTVILSVNSNENEKLLKIAKNLTRVKIKILTTKNNYNFLTKNNIECKLIQGIEGNNSIIHAMKKYNIGYIINTPSKDNESINDTRIIRKEALKLGIPTITSIKLGRAIGILTEYLRFLVDKSF